jgi:hypothetical protein
MHEVDEVELVDERVGDLDEDSSEPLGGNGGHGCFTAFLG